MTREYIVVICRAWMNEHGHGFDYYSDMQRFADRQAAIRHGFTLGESDDFGIGTVVGKKLTAYGWMDRDFDDASALSEIARQLYLEEGVAT